MLNGTPGSARSPGYRRSAISTISAAFLFQFGTGPIRGFAVTLTVGLLANVFTAVYVSRRIFELVLGNKKVESLSI